MKEIINKFMHSIGYHIMKNPVWRRRNSTYFVELQQKKDLVVVEIGTFRGVNAESICERLDVKKLYLIDSYTYDEDDCSGVPQLDLEEAEQMAREKLSKFKDMEIIFIKKKSDDSLKDIPNDVDFIYIDGDHNYSQVKKDIINYYPKVKEGGVLGGHNIEMNGVTKAFVEFVSGKKIKDYYIDCDDWWLIK